METQVILVDKTDIEIGTMGKMEAHQKGALHRAFSVLLFNSKGEMLVQKRAKSKYHSGGLWSNACCSHPLPGETTDAAVARRLYEELGINVDLRFSYKFIYRISFENDLVEHEYDHVFIGTFDGMPTANTDEIEDWKFMSQKELKQQALKHPEEYTHWFKLILDNNHRWHRSSR